MVATLQVYLWKMKAPPSWSSRSLIRRIRKWYLIVILLMAQLSTHILQLSSFFGVNRAGTTQGLILGWIWPFFSSFSIRWCKISYSCGLILQWGREEPGIKSMLCWMSQREGGSVDSSLILETDPTILELSVAHVWSNLGKNGQQQQGLRYQILCL